MYAQSSPRSPRRGDPVNVSPAGAMAGVSSPTKGVVGGVVVGVRSSASAGSLLSPSRNRRRTSSNQGSRSGSPLSLPMENVQSVNAAYSMSQAYLGDGVASPSSSSTRSPYQSPAHSRSSSMTSVKSLLRDRSSERGGGGGELREHVDLSHIALPHHAHNVIRSPLIRDRSLDRSLDRHQRDTDRYHTYSGHRDRSERDKDRDYPHMGARSLEREHHSNLVRSRSIDYEYVANQAAFLPPAVEMHHHARDTLILDLQSQIAELNKECAIFQQELDIAKEKLNSSMNSIKTFWSPELKKERYMRKEECAKYQTLTDQFKILHAEKKKQTTDIHQLQDELRCCRENPTSPAGLATSPSSFNSSSSSPAGHQGEPHNQLTAAAAPGSMLSRERDRNSKEVRILRKTIEEMELRIETQKQTLDAREESIKKLLEMLQSKGLAVKQIDDDRLETERLRVKAVEDARRARQLEQLLEQRDRQIDMLKENLVGKTGQSFQLDGNTRDWDTLQAMLETKDSRLQSLEREVRVLEDELLRSREEVALCGGTGTGTGTGGTAGVLRDHRDNGQLQLDSLKNQEKLLKLELDTSRTDSCKKDSEIYGLRTQMETYQKQGADHQSHITVLREQITAKEQQAAMVQADMDALRERMREKDLTIGKKTQQIQQQQNERKRLEAELQEVGDHIDIKERKISVLQRKMDNLEDQVKDKESQLSVARTKLSANQASQHSLTSLEETLLERERQLDRLREQREQSEREHLEESETYQRTAADLKTKVEQLQLQLDDRQHSLLELREESSELKVEKTRRDSQVAQLQHVLTQKAEEIQQLREQLEKVEVSQVEQSSKASAESARQAAEVASKLTQSRDEAHKAQSEVDRLLDILKDSENEKHVKDDLISDLQEQVKEYRQKMGTLKRSQQTEKNKSANMLEEARKREENVTDDASQLKNVIKQNDNRIEELEEALRESVKITAQREMVMAQQQMQGEKTDKQMRSLSEEFLNLKRSHSEKSDRIATVTSQLEARGQELCSLHEDRRKQLAEVYEMKQEALQASISEKDAHIALLEIAPNKQTENIDEVEKLTKEKHKLQQQLKDLTQSRMKLLHGDNNSSNDSSLSKQLQNAPKEHGQDENGIWT